MKNIKGQIILFWLICSLQTIYGTTAFEYNQAIKALRSSSIFSSLLSQEQMTPARVVEIENQLKQAEQEGKHTGVAFYIDNREDELFKIIIAAMNNEEVDSLGQLPHKSTKIYNDTINYSVYEQMNEKEPINLLDQNSSYFADFIIKHGYNRPKFAFTELYNNPNLTTLWNFGTDPMIAATIATMTAAGLGYVYYRYKQYQKEQDTLKKEAKTEEE